MQVGYKERGAGVIARDTVAAGVEVVLVGGGDGTVREVAREFYRLAFSITSPAASACRRSCLSRTHNEIMSLAKEQDLLDQSSQTCDPMGIRGYPDCFLRPLFVTNIQ